MNLIRGHVHFESLKKRLNETAKARLTETAEEACSAAKGFAPVETGKLQNSIAVWQKGDWLIVGTDCEYACSVEFGTSRRAAQPFMSKAVRAIRESRKG